jgi:RES domain-containing protein
VFLWRISNHLSLAGDGGLRASGRWHTRGRRIVYCAEHPAAALLEVLVHFELDIRDLPAQYRLLKISVPEDVRGQRVSLAELDRDWIDNTQGTRGMGDTWLARSATALLTVPSAVVPETFSVLVNPAHPDTARITIAQATDHVIDPRLLS